MRLDSLDRKILALLDTDARLSTSDIARTVKHGRDIVHYRVERLFREEFLLGTQAIINPCLLGFTLYKTYMRLKNDRTRAQSFIARLRNDPNIFCLALCDGTWDVVFTSLARNPIHFDRIQNELLTDFHDLIIEFEVVIVVEQTLSRRGYFGSKGERTFVIGGEPREKKIDKLHILLVDLLVKDARLSVAELARRTTGSASAVQSRIDEMEKSGLIVGYRAVPNLPKLGRTNFKTQLFLRSFSGSKIAALMSYAALHPSIVKVIRQLGNCKLELGIEAESYEHFNSITQELRSAFPDLIVNISTILVRDEVYRWLHRTIDVPQLDLCTPVERPVAA